MPLPISWDDIKDYIERNRGNGFPVDTNSIFIEIIKQGKNISISNHAIYELLIDFQKEIILN